MLEFEGVKPEGYTETCQKDLAPIRGENKLEPLLLNTVQQSETIADGFSVI